MLMYRDIFDQWYENMMAIVKWLYRMGHNLTKDKGGAPDIPMCLESEKDERGERKGAEEIGERRGERRGEKGVCVWLSCGVGCVLGGCVAMMKEVSEWVIKFNSLSVSRQRCPCSPYKPCDYRQYIGILIFPHMNNTQITGHNSL